MCFCQSALLQKNFGCSNLKAAIYAMRESFYFLFFPEAEGRQEDWTEALHITLHHSQTSPRTRLVWPPPEDAFLNVFIFLLSTHSLLAHWSFLQPFTVSCTQQDRCLEQRSIPGFSILMGVEALRPSHCFRAGCGSSTWTTAIYGGKYHGIIG